MISTIIHGNIPGKEDVIIYPFSIFIHNDELYFTDRYLICKILPNGTVKTIAGIENEKGFNGDDKLAIECKLYFPEGLFVDNDSEVYFANSNSHCIRKIDRNGMMRRVIGTVGEYGYSGDVPFDFEQYPHIGPRKKTTIKPFPHAYHDLIVTCVDSFNEPIINVKEN